jgi:hypothetical protein
MHIVAEAANAGADALGADRTMVLEAAKAAIAAIEGGFFGF